MKNIFWLILLLLCSKAIAQQNNLYFNRLTVENGLPEGLVTSALQDNNGYIWMGTQNGLVRYDGYALKRYTMPGTNGKPLPAYSVYSIYKDAAGTLWVQLRLQEGEYYYNPQKDAFIKLSYYDEGKNMWHYRQGQTYIMPKPGVHWGAAFINGVTCIQRLDTATRTLKTFNLKPNAHNATFSIGADAAGRIWATTDSLLAVYDTVKKTFVPYFVLPAMQQQFVFNDIYADPADPDILWLTTLTSQTFLPGYIVKYNTASKKYTIFLDSNNAAGNPVTGITLLFTDNLKRLWFAAGSSLFLYNRQTEGFTTFTIAPPGLPAGGQGNINDLAADSSGCVWVATSFTSLVRINPHTGVIHYYPPVVRKPGGLPYPTDGIRKVFFDKAGILWLSIPYQGMAYLSPQKTFFNPIAVRPPGLPGDDVNHTSVVVGIKNDSTVFVTSLAGFFTWQYVTNIFSKINIPDSVGKKGIPLVYTDAAGQYWFTGNAGGLFCFNPVTQKTIAYHNNPKDSFSLPGELIASITGGANGVLWIGTNSKGMCSFNPQTGRFTPYPYIINTGSLKAGNKLDDRTVETIVLSGDKNTLWAGTNIGGLNRLNIQTGQFTSFLDFPNGLSCVTSIYRDSRGRLWAGTYMGGLFLMDEHTGSYKRFTENDGLAYAGAIADGIKEDKNGNIWVFSPRGPSVINAATGAITVVKALAITQSQGSVVSGLRGVYQDGAGSFYECFDDKVIVFNPVAITKSTTPPQVIIENIGYHAANSTVTANDTTVFTTTTRQLELQHNENRLTFTYVGLHFGDADQNKYAYMLQGYDKVWVQAGTLRQATYTNLSPGTYTFMVKAANSDGVWNEQGVSITVTILPPWWFTWWAWALYVVAFATLVFAFIQYRGRRLLRDNRILEHKVHIRTEEVLQQKEEIEAQRDELERSFVELQATQNQLIQSEKMASLGELTAGIAHEIQNPLNFVNNFSEVSQELVTELEGERQKVEGERDKGLEDELLADIKQNLEKINHHGKRADGIVKSMLQHSRKSTGQKEITDINTLADEYLRLSYHGLRAKNKSFNAELTTQFDTGISKVRIIPQDVGRVLLNLYNNAFYAVAEKNKTAPAGYKPTVTVTTKQQANNIVITVADNGNGIPENIKAKIFQPFFTTKPTGQGTGLGLSLSYDIIKAHNGQIAVDTTQGEGTEFIITLPANV